MDCESTYPVVILIDFFAPQPRASCLPLNQKGGKPGPPRLTSQKFSSLSVFPIRNVAWGCSHSAYFPVLSLDLWGMYYYFKFRPTCGESAPLECPMSFNSFCFHDSLSDLSNDNSLATVQLSNHSNCLLLVLWILLELTDELLVCFGDYSYTCAETSAYQTMYLYEVSNFITMYGSGWMYPWMHLVALQTVLQCCILLVWIHVECCYEGVRWVTGIARLLLAGSIGSDSTLPDCMRRYWMQSSLSLQLFNACPFIRFWVSWRTNILVLSLFVHCSYSMTQRWLHLTELWLSWKHQLETPNHTICLLKSS